MMRTAETYILEERGIEMPKGNIPGSWFVENDLPMIVECACCWMTRTRRSAMGADDGEGVCAACAGGL